MNVFLKLFLVFLCASPAFADATRNKLNDLSERLITSFTAKTPGKTAIAIFPLNADEKLTKRKAGFAVSEILSRKFIASEKFTVVERGDIDSFWMLAEQKLQASGAVGADSAVSIGKIIGVKAILTGDILRIGGQYQVNIRLVDTESSEVIGSGYAELDSAAFEEEARPYLNLVPDEQVLSIYFLYNFRNNANNVGATMHDNGLIMLYNDPSPFNLGMLGGGIRYFPSQKIFVDVSLAGNGKQKVGDFTTSIIPARSYYIGVLSFRGLLGYKTKIGDKFNLYTGVGATSYEITGKDRWGNSGGNVSYYTPIIQARMEYRPQSRVGVSIAADYDFIAKIGTREGYKMFILGKLSFEPSVSLYF